MDDRPSKYRLAKLKKCAECKHHISAHKYHPHVDGKTHPPDDCLVPGCSCTQFKRHT